MDSVERLIGRTSGRILDKLQAAGEEKSLPFTAPAPAAHNEEGTFAMTYGHSMRAFTENGPTDLVARVDALRSPAREWRARDEARRLELVERALCAANDIEGFPIAL
jgi:hypothetical protein